MRLQVRALTLVSAILVSLNAFSFEQVTSESFDDFGNAVTTYTNIDDDGNKSYGGQVINRADGSAEQMNSEGQLISTWGGGQDAATITYQNADFSGNAVQVQSWTRTDSNGNEYNGGAVVTSPNGSTQYDSDNNVMNSW